MVCSGFYEIRIQIILCQRNLLTFFGTAYGRRYALLQFVQSQKSAQLTNSAIDRGVWNITISMHYWSCTKFCKQFAWSMHAKSLSLSDDFKSTYKDQNHVTQPLSCWEDMWVWERSIQNKWKWPSSWNTPLALQFMLAKVTLGVIHFL